MKVLKNTKKYEIFILLFIEIKKKINYYYKKFTRKNHQFFY